MTTGVYQITNTTTGKFYVGSSVDIMTRWRKHRERLRRGAHSNSYLQRAWEKYGEESFSIRVLCVCERVQLRTAEQLFLDTTGCCTRSVGYNINTLADRPTWSAESRAAISAANRGVRAGKALLTEEQVVALRNEYASSLCSQKSLGEKYGLTAGAVNAILSGKSYSDCGGTLLPKSERLLRAVGTGSANGRAKLSEAQATQILDLHAQGHSRSVLAKTFGVSYSTVVLLVTGRTWKHLVRS